MVRKTKEHVKANGILSTPNPKLGDMLKDDTVKIICEFHDVDEISKVYARGKKILHL
jgi:hypothetical protein